MIMYLLKRLLAGVVLIAVLSFLTFVLLYMAGGDVARNILGEQATVETVAKKTHELGLDRPLLVQYADWAMHAVTGNLGRSWFSGELVTTTLSTRIMVTLTLVGGATIVAALLAIVFGVLAARRGGWIDAVVQVGAFIGFAVPNFLIALALVLVFAINLHWFKATGIVPPQQSIVGWLSTITLPIAALSIGAMASIVQQVRGSVVDSVSRDYVRTLRARGFSESTVIYRHVLRNAGGPALAVLGVQFIGLLSGTVVIEQVFAIPGLGQATVSATSLGDVPLVMGLVVVFVILVVIVNLLIDLGQAALNPKVRLA